MIDLKSFSGIMNLDDANHIIGPTHHRDGRNILFRGSGDKMRVENIKGTTLISNTLPSGINEAIGALHDPVKKRIYTFMWNSLGLHLIYYYSISDNTFTTLILNGTQTANVDVLGFSLSNPIVSVDIIYSPDGDLLLWTDGGRPKCINVDTVTSYTTLKGAFINLAKVWPWKRISCTYGNDVNVPSNSLKRKLFRFKYRWVYNNNLKSTWSPISKIPLPVNFSDEDANNIQTNNNFIALSIPTGDDDVVSIEIAVGESNGTGWNDFMLVETISKVDYGFASSTFYTYNFYNDGAYATIDVDESNLLFDLIPDRVNALGILNGNVIIFGGISENYDQILRSSINVQITTGVGQSNIPNISSTYDGLHAFYIQIGPIVTTSTAYHVQFNYSSTLGGDASPKNVTYTSILGDTPTDVAIRLVALLNGSNIIAQSLGAGYMKVQTTSGAGTVTSLVTNIGTAGSEQSVAAFDFDGISRWGIVYNDERGKTNGVVSFVNTGSDATDFSVALPAFTVTSNKIQLPYISVSISHLPPSWATSFQLVRTVNLACSKFLYHITNDYQSDTNYLYFCIENLTYNKTKNSGFVPAYDFAEGDRVKILASYNTGTGFYTPYASYLDLEIVGVESKTMTSPASAGKFIKVRKPSSFPSYLGNSLIKIYTPALRVTDDSQQVFYEFGETYQIQNGYHTGGTSNQTAVAPATFQIFDGDVYFKKRSFYLDVNGTTIISAYMMDANFNDYFPSAVNSNGRPLVIDKAISSAFNGTLIRWSLAYQKGTNINQMNRFFPDNFDEIDAGRGDIMRFKVREKELRIFQKHGVARHYIYTKFIKNNEGQDQLITTNEIITRKNVQYYEGQYGMGDYGTNLVSNKSQDYFFDYVQGIQCRLGGDGIDEISTLYKGQYTLKALSVEYNNNWTRTNGGAAKIMGYYDYFDNQYITLLQGGGRYTSPVLFSIKSQFVSDDINFQNGSALAVHDQVESGVTLIVTFANVPIYGDTVRIKGQWNDGTLVDITSVSQSGWTLTNLINDLITRALLVSGISASPITYNGAAGIQISKSPATVLTGSSLVILSHRYYVVKFFGAVQAGDILSTTLTANNGDAGTYTYTVIGGDTLTTARNALVALINAGGKFTAVSQTFSGFQIGFYAQDNVRSLTNGVTTFTRAYDVSIPDYTFSFNEPRNAYCSFYDFHPEWIICAEDDTYSWKSGQMYIHNNTTNYCNFYGVQFSPSIKLVFNDKVAIKKKFLTVSYQSNQIWVSDTNGDINTSMINEFTSLFQISQLKSVDYEILSGNINAAFLHDANSNANSSIGLLEGDDLEGVWIEINFIYKGVAQAWLFLPDVQWQPNNRNF